MLHSINEILDRIPKQSGLASIADVQGADLGRAGELGVPTDAVVMSIKPEDFVALPAADQEALINAGYDLRQFVNTTQFGMVSNIPFPPRIYLLKWSDDSGRHYKPLGDVLSDRCNLAAYACGRLQGIVSGGRPLLEDTSSLYEKMQPGRRTLFEEGVGYVIIPAENFSMADMVTLFKQGWKVRMFKVDGEEHPYYYKTVTSPAVPVE